MAQARRRSSFLKTHYTWNAIDKLFVNPIMKGPKMSLPSFEDEYRDWFNNYYGNYDAIARELGMNRPPRYMWAHLSRQEYEKMFPLTKKQKEMIDNRREEIRKKMDKDAKDAKIMAIILGIIGAIILILAHI